jgi:hypothetical protein
MADSATQYLLPLRDIVELVVKKVDVHEGHWTASVGVQIGAGAFGPTPDQQFPGAAVTVANFGIQRVDESNAQAMNSPLTVDAAIVNPKPKEKKKPT